jgi:hypothetical protein
MKKEILFGAIALLISAGVMAQTTEPVQTQTKTKKQLRIEARQQKQVQEQVQSGDPIMTQTGTRTENHGAVVSETAKQVPGGEGKGQIVSEQARMKGEAQKSMKEAKKASKNKSKAKSVRSNRPAVGKGTGAGRR